MNAYGIVFAHRRPQAEDSSLEFAQFTAFAALCAHHGAASAVRRVFYDTKWAGFNIEGAPEVRGGQQHQVIQWCAEQSLPQFMLFDCIGYWDRWTNPLEPGCDDEVAF